MNKAAIEANRRGVALRAQGRASEAIDAFRAGIDAQPDIPELHANLAVALADAGHFDEARAAFETALSLDPDNMSAHWGMYEVELVTGNRNNALAHQQRVLNRKTLFTQRALREQRAILVLMAPGDWQANVPIDFLIDPATTTLHKFFIVSPEQAARADLPEAGVAFNAIAESEENAPRLRIASSVVSAMGVPCINHPSKVFATNRVRLYEALHAVPDTIVPETKRVGREQLVNGQHGMAYPLVVRPVDSQAGRDLARIDDAAGLAAYVARTDAGAFYVMPFIDFISTDGYYRKYRVIVVDGVPYPYHLAISPRWIIHYYNAPMRENAWMRDEEQRFLSGFDAVFPAKLQQALRNIASILGLEYFGVDCSIDRDGRLVVFEADPAMIVHAGDDPALFAFKYPYARRIFAAFETLISNVAAGPSH
jgi:tetratricopeptide (TPR) repeat protein